MFEYAHSAPLYSEFERAGRGGMFVGFCKVLTDETFIVISYISGGETFAYDFTFGIDESSIS